MDPYNTADAHPAPAPSPQANPYAAPSANVAVVAAQGEFEKSSRLARLGAVLLDSAIVAVPAVVLALLLPAMAPAGEGGAQAIIAVVMSLFGLGLLGFVVFQLVLLHRYGQTLGKRIVGIRIVRSDGSRAGLRRIFLLRGFVPGLIGAIPLIGPFFSLANVLAIFGSEKRCVHDLIADTIVVDA